MQTDTEMEECSLDYDINDPDAYAIQIFGYDPRIVRPTTALHHTFYDSIKSKDKDSFILCLKTMSSPLDIAYACVCCVLFDWPDALEHAVANPAFFGHEYARCRDPSRNFFWEAFDDSVIGVKHLRHSSHIIEGAAHLTIKYRSYRCFEVFMKVRKEGRLIFYPNSFLNKVYDEVKAESGQVNDTLDLQNKFAKPIYEYVLESGDEDEFHWLILNSLRSNNLRIIDSMLNSENAINLLDPESSTFQGLSSCAAGLGMNELAVTFFEKQKARKPFSMFNLLRSAFESRNLKLIEMVLTFYGDECDTFIEEELTQELYIYLTLKGKHNLFKMAFPSFNEQSNNTLLSPVSMSDEHAVEKQAHV